MKKNIANDFPALKQLNRNKRLVYLDSGASAQKPQSVIDAMSHFYSHDYANIHRGIYELSERSTRLYENARVKTADFIHAASKKNIVFTHGTTDAMNLLAFTLSVSHLKKDDEIIISEMEHHANIVPWVMLKERIGIHIKVIRVTNQGELDFDHYKSLVTSKTKLVSIMHVSNVLGTINPVKEYIDYAHQYHIPVIIDGAQAVPHIEVDVEALGCDFYVFSAHKMYGPTGIGVLYAKGDWLDKLPPYQGGGDMIETVSFDQVTFTKGSQKFEAGTPPIAEAVGLAAAIDYMQSIGMRTVFQHDVELVKYATEKLTQFPNIKIIGTARQKTAVISFVHQNIHPHDLATILDHEGIAVRAGHHCAMPLMDRFQIPAAVRVSFGVYNTEADIDRLVDAIKTAERIFDHVVA